MNQVICPHCGKEVELTAALRHEIEEQISAEFKKTQEVEIEKIRTKTQEEVKKKIEEEISLKMKNAENENEELKARNRKMQEEILDMNKTLREIKDQGERAKVENEKRLNESIDKIKDEITNRNKLEILEMQKKLEDTQKALDEAQRKSKQGSQQLQGEVLELDLEGQLSANFPNDEVLPVAKGVSGADVLQRVRNNRGQVAGSILWELKRTKAWSNSWLPKLREDMRANASSVSVLITDVLPDTIKSFGLVEGVWVITYSYAIPVATLLRTSLMQIAVAKTAASHKDERLEELYQYLTSETFRHRFEAQVEAAVELQNDLETEKRSALRLWKKRELQIKRMIGNTSNMYGELQGIVGGALPSIKSLEGPEVEEVPEVEEAEELKLLND